MQLYALFTLGFPAASDLQPLTSLHIVTRRSVLQKVRGRALNRASSACKHRVSGSLSLPSRGSFHLSLTVLCSIGHQVIFSLGGWSPLLPTGFHVSCGTLGHGLNRRSPCRLPGFHRLWPAFPIQFVFGFTTSTGPQPHCPRAVVWAPPLSLATTQGIVFTFFSSGYLDVSVRRVPSL